MSVNQPSESMKFDLEPIVVKIDVGPKSYRLVEASGDAATKYRNSVLRGTKLADGKVVGVDGMADAEPLLVSRCLYTPDSDGNLIRLSNGNLDSRYLVSLQTILGWNSRIQKALFKRVKEISDLGENPATAEELRRRIALDTEALEELEGKKEQGLVVLNAKTEKDEDNGKDGSTMMDGSD